VNSGYLRDDFGAERIQMKAEAEPGLANAVRHIIPEAMLENFVQDIRYGHPDAGQEPRVHRRRGAYPGARMAANTAIFSVVQNVLLRPLPYKQPEKR